MLTIALPKGRLRRAAETLCRAAEQQHVHGTITIIEMRARDIARYIGHGDIDAGVTAEDLAAEIDNPASSPVYTQPGPTTDLHWLAPPGLTTPTQLHGARIATAYPRLAIRAAAHQGIRVAPVVVSGTAETCIRAGLAAAAVDVVDTGNTAARHHLAPLGPPILTSRPILLRRTRELSAVAERALRDLIDLAESRAPQSQSCYETPANPLIAAYAHS